MVVGGAFSTADGMSARGYALWISGVWASGYTVGGPPGSRLLAFSFQLPISPGLALGGELASLDGRPVTNYFEQWSLNGVLARCFCSAHLGVAPCGNSYESGGCANSTGVGAMLGLSGSSGLGDQATNQLVLHAKQARPNKACVWLQGTGQAQSPFKDGNICVAGMTIRLPGFGCGPQPIGTLDAEGCINTADPVYGFDVVAADTCKGGTIAAGVAGSGSAVRDYQLWYRDGMGPCGTGSNLSHGLTATWTP